jgi:putative membrane protein
MMDGWDWVWGTLMMVVFWGGLSAVIVVGVRAFGGNSRRGAGEAEKPDAKAILDARFARGEISQEEFEDRKRALGLGDGVNRQYDGKVAGVR